VDETTSSACTSTLFSGPWRALEHALALRLQELRRDDPLCPLVVVCGSSAAAVHVRRRVARELAGLRADAGPPRGGLAGVSFTTLHRLASDALRVAGGGAQSRLSSVEELRLISGVVADRGAETYFAPILSAPGLPRALRRTFKDLREAQLLPADLTARVHDPGVTGLASLYETYLDRLAQTGRLDDPTLYRRAAQVASGSPEAMTVSWVGLYGLYDLPATQQAFIGAIAGLRYLDAFVPGPEDASYSAETRAFLSGLAGAAVSAAGLPGAPHDGPVPEIVSVENGSAERAEIVRVLFEAVESGARPDGGSYRFHEIAVVHADPAWRGLLVEDLEREHVPVAARVRRPTPGGRAVTGLLECLAPAAGIHFERGAVIELAAVRASFLDEAAARSSRAPGRSPRRAAEVARWDRLSRDARVVGGADGWRERVAGLVERSGAERDRARADALLTFIGSLEALSAAAAPLTSWSQLSDWLGGALDGLGVPADDPVRSVVHGLRTVDDIEAAVSLDTFAVTVRGLVSERRTVLGSLGRTGVAVVSPEELRGLTVPFVVFGGLVEGLFPPRPAPDPLLADAHRKKLSGETSGRLPTSELRGQESDLLFSLTCEAATERVVLVRARSKDGTGAPQLASRHLAALLRERVRPEEFRLALVDDDGRFGDVHVRRVPAGTIADAGLPGEVPGADRRAADAAALSRLAHDRGAQREAVEGYLSAMLGDEAAACRRLEALRSRRRSELTPWDGVIGDEGLRDAVFARLLSASAVEDYLSCPFVFFVRRVLRADAVEEPEEAFDIAASDLGLLVHRVLQRVFGLVREGADSAAVLAAFDGVAAEEFASGAAEGITGFPLAWDGKRRQVAADLRRVIADDPCWRDDVRPELFEWEFGGEGLVPAVEVAGRTLRFRGFVDRIDVDAGRTAARVLDYKTGKGDVQAKAVKDGADIQLPVYRLAAELLLSGVRELSCGYRFVTRASGFRGDVTLTGDSGAVREALRSALAPFVAGVEQGLFVRRHDSSRCRWCDLAYACGVTASADAAKTAAAQRLTGAEPAGEGAEP